MTVVAADVPAADQAVPVEAGAVLVDGPVALAVPVGARLSVAGSAGRKAQAVRTIADRARSDPGEQADAPTAGHARRETAVALVVREVKEMTAADHRAGTARNAGSAATVSSGMTARTLSIRWQAGRRVCCRTRVPWMPCRARSADRAVPIRFLKWPGFSWADASDSW